MWKAGLVLAACCALSGPAWGQPSGCDLTARKIEDAGAGCQRAWMDHNLKLNDIVSVGTHNSYKVELPEQIMAMLRASAPESAEELDYRHRPLSEQLDAGARQLEIDVYNDPQGARFIAPVGLRAAGISLAPAQLAALAKPGFKVMHVQDIDVLSSCASWPDCLGIVRRWSLAHPDHAPILIMVNAKTDKAELPGGVDALPFDSAAFDALDRDVRAVFPPEALITPDDVQAGFPTLREAVLSGGWPSLGKARGRVMFALDEDADKVAIYRGGRQSLEGRVFFVNTDEASPAAAYLTLNDPVLEGDRIRRAVAAGFIVRTRADAGTHEARADDTRRRDAALASGAQFVSTDYLWPEPRLHNDYQVRLPGNAAALCNPVRTAKRCAGMTVEPAAADKQH